MRIQYYFYVLVLLMITLLFNVLAEDQSVSGEKQLYCLRSNTNLHTKIIRLDLDKDGIKEYQREEIFRGTNKILTSFCDKSKTTHVFSLGNYCFIEYDGDGDGLFEEVSIMRDGFPVDAFKRLKDGRIEAMSTPDLVEMQKSCLQATELMTNLVTAVTNKDHKVIRRTLERIEKIERPREVKDQ